MSASPPTISAPSTKRPLEDPSSPFGPTDQPDAKRPALDKIPQGNGDEVEPKVEDAETELNDVAILPVENGTKDGEDTKIPDAPVDGEVPQTIKSSTSETHPIESTTGHNDRGSRTPSGHQDETAWIHVRSVITSAEAATVIGKGGENVTQIRRLSGAKCTVSDYSRGAVERILTVSGLVDAVAKVCLMHLPPDSLISPTCDQIN
jgi:poly(rC)-binding protein 2/3/4